MEIKVTDRRRFDLTGKPRENGEVKCTTCKGEGRVVVPPDSTVVTFNDGSGHKDRGEACPACGGKGTP